MVGNKDLLARKKEQFLGGRCARDKIINLGTSIREIAVDPFAKLVRYALQRKFVENSGMQNSNNGFGVDETCTSSRKAVHISSGTLEFVTDSMILLITTRRKRSL